MPFGSSRTTNTTAGRGPSGNRLAAPSDSVVGYSGARPSGRYIVVPRCQASTVERVAGLHEPADVGDRVAQHQIVAGGLERERLIEIGRRCRVEGDERQVGAIDVLGAGRRDRRPRPRPPRPAAGTRWARRTRCGCAASPAASNRVAASDDARISDR